MEGMTLAPPMWAGCRQAVAVSYERGCLSAERVSSSSHIGTGIAARSTSARSPMVGDSAGYPPATLGGSPSPDLATIHAATKFSTTLGFTIPA